MSTDYPIFDVKSIPSLLGDENFIARVVTVTPSVAREILGYVNYPKNRSINQNSVKKLASFMEDGSFAPDSSTINFSVEGESVELTDGQHRLTAMTIVQKTYRFGILITRTPAKYIYGKTDRGRSRSLRDVIHSSGVAARMGISETGSNVAAVGLKTVKNGYSLRSTSDKVSEDHILECLEKDYKAIVLHIFDILHSLEFGRKLQSRTPMSLWLTLYKEFPDDQWKMIDDFLYGCATNSGLESDDPRRWVYLLYAKYNRSGGSIRRVTMSKVDELGVLLTAWEYWFLKKPSKRDFQSKTIERVLKSTPNVAGTNISYKL